MADIPCFLLEFANRSRRSLRRYSSGSACAGALGYHDTQVTLDEIPTTYDAECSLFVSEGQDHVSGDVWPHDDARWPTHCACGYAFTQDDNWQMNIEPLHASERGQVTLREARGMPGAMYRMPWLARVDWSGRSQDDGAPLCVVTPGGAWSIDSQSLNCTMPDDSRQERHHCWVRSGIPPLITVDKNGVTCAAGAGSIQCGPYHGFLRNGHLVD